MTKNTYVATALDGSEATRKPAAGGGSIYVMHIFVWSQWLTRVPATATAIRCWS